MMERAAHVRARRSAPFRGRGSGVLARLLVWSLLLVFPLTLLLGATGTAHADDEDTLGRLSFYRLSSSMTALFSTAQEPKSDIGLADTEWEGLLDNPASAGSMLGYADSDYNPIMGWLNSSIAQSSDSVGYDTLSGNEDAGISGVQGAREYALFGATLNGLGLDSTSTGLSLGFFNSIAGGIIFILYTCAAAIDVLWGVLIGALVWLNPFRLFYGAVSVLSPEFANGMTGGEGPENAFGSLSEWIGQWYLVLVELSWTVMVPLFIGTFLFSMVMFKKFDKGSGLKKLFIRLLFIGLGLPLLGSMYTGTLTAMEQATEGGNSGSTRVVLSTFVDFEGWAMQQRLRVPDKAGHEVYIEWDHRRNAPSGRSQASVRELALLINAQVLGLEGRITPVSAGEGDSWGQTALDPAAESAFTTTTYTEVADILFRYMGTAHVSASSFETQSKATLHCEEDDCNARAWFEDYIGDPEDVVDVQDQVPVSQNPLIWVNEGTGLSAYREGQESTGSPISDIFNYLRFTSFHTRGDVGDCGLRLARPDGSPESCNLSPLAMYNYLNTDFGPTSYTAYSSGKTTSEATRSIHNSVSMVGTGTMSFVYWVNAVVLLGAFVTIGFGYAIAMVIGNIRRSFQMMTAIPFATLGAMSGIAKVIVYTVAMIMEVVITLFLYKFVQEFLLSIPSIIEIPFSQALNNGDEGDTAGMIAFLISGGFITMVVTLVSIIAVVLFTVMAMRLRKTLVKAVEEASTKLVEKLTDSQIAPPGGGGGALLPAMAGGAAGGAGSAMANRMVGGGPQGGKGPSAGGTNGAGPDGISTSAASTNDTRVGGDVDTDGTLEGPADAGTGGGGDGGAGLEPGGQGGDAERETELGRHVEANGLSLPPGSDAPGPSDPDNPRVGDGDPMDVAAASAQHSADEYRRSDQARVGAVKDGAAAGVHAGVAVGRGMAGDGVGAAESGGKAVEKGGSAVAKNAQASQHREQAGKSSLDSQAPNPKHSQRIEQGRQASQAGRAVSDTAGMASGGTGGKPGGGGPKPTGSPPSTGQGGGKTGKGPRGGGRRK